MPKLKLTIGSFSSSVDATSYIYASEIFPTPARARGLAISVSGLFVATIIFLQAAPTAFDAVGWKYYLVFVCITTVIFGIAWFWFPEVCQVLQGSLYNTNSRFRRAKYLWRRLQSFSILSTQLNLKRPRWNTKRKWPRPEIFHGQVPRCKD